MLSVHLCAIEDDCCKRPLAVSERALVMVLYRNKRRMESDITHLPATHPMIDYGDQLGYNVATIRCNETAALSTK